MRRLLLPVHLVLLVTGICLAGCTAARPGAGCPAFPPGTIAPGSPAPAVPASTLAQSDVDAEKARQRWNVPGMAVAIVKDGKIVAWSRSLWVQMAMPGS